MNVWLMVIIDGIQSRRNIQEMWQKETTQDLRANNLSGNKTEDGGGGIASKLS